MKNILMKVNMKFFYIITLTLISTYELSAVNVTNNKQVPISHTTQLNNFDRDKIQNYHYYRKNIGKCWLDWNILYWQCN